MKACENIDHFIPLSKKGTNLLYNLVPSCEECNTKKADRMPTEHERIEHDRKLTSFFGEKQKRVNKYISSKRNEVLEKETPEA